MKRFVALAALLFVSSAHAADPAARRPNVIFILVDTLRADHLGCYGFKGAAISPNIDRFSKDCIFFERCATPATWTKPAITSIFTSLYPETHHIVNAALDEKGMPKHTDVLPKERTTMAESFAKTGYRTVEIVANPWIKPESGLTQGFQEYTFVEKPELIDTAINWFKKNNAAATEKKPLFLYIHVLDVHGHYMFKEEDFQLMRAALDDGHDAILQASDKEQVPWYMAPTFKDHPERWASTLNWRAAYAAGVKRFDGRFGELMYAISGAGYFSNSIIVMTSDHGEGLWQHGWLEHGKTLNIEEVQVPLLIRMPKGERAGRRMGSWMSLVDLYPTLADLCKLNVKGVPFQGVSLASAVMGGPLPKRIMYSDTFMLNFPQKSAIRETMQLILKYPNPQTTDVSLFDILADRPERNNIASQRPGVASELKLAVEKHVGDQKAGRQLPKEQAPMTEEMKEQLRSLGYLQ